MEITTELKQTLKRLKLGGILATLPERGSYAKAQKLSHGEFLELVLNDEIERREQGRTMRKMKRRAPRPGADLRAVRLGGPDHRRQREGEGPLRSRLYRPA